MSASFRDLVAWQRAMALAEGAFTLARALRHGRHAGLAIQLERAATSVPSNIAEGQGRTSGREFARFLTIAMGSLREVETLVSLAGRIGAARNETVIALLQMADETGRVLHGLRRSIEPSKPGRPPKPQPPTES